MSFTKWGAFYIEIAEKAKAIDEINWIDLWHNQVGFLVEEHPFPTPALFLDFRIISVEEDAERVQTANVQIDMYYFYETFLDTYDGAYNQQDAIAYLDTLTKIHATFHGIDGETFSGMTRVGFAPVDTGSAGNLYRQSFVCRIIDFSAIVNYGEAAPGDVSLSEGETPQPQSGEAFVPPSLT